MLIRSAYAGKLFPGVQVQTFRAADRAFASRVVARGKHVFPFVRADRSFEDLQIRSRSEDYDLFDYVSRNRVAGLLILQRGKILLEHYDFGNDDKTPWLSMSMAKSISSVLVGAAIHDGYIR